MVLLLSGDYASMFQPRAAQTDKHNRSHELYAVSQAVRVGRRVAEAQAKRRSQRRPAAAAAVAPPATVSDAGSHFIVSGPTRESVEAELARLEQEIEQIDGVWTAVLDDAS